MDAHDPKNVIDAQRRFGRAHPSTSPVMQGNEGTADRQRQRASLAEQARVLEQELRGSRRLSLHDRREIARNLGRLIERSHPAHERIAVAMKIIREAYPGEAGISMEKKRKRYIRFSDEPSPYTSDPGEYCAHGDKFFFLTKKYCEMYYDSQGSDGRTSLALLQLCKGTSLEVNYVDIRGGGDHYRSFTSSMQQMIDRVVKNADLVGYLGEVRNYSVEVEQSISHDSPWPTIALQRGIPTKFVHEHQILGSSYYGYSKLHLDGFSVRHEEPPFLLPKVRLCRVYWPYSALCLPFEIDPKEFAKAEECRREEDFVRGLLNREYGSDRIQWDEFIDPVTEEAINGARWMPYYVAYGFDLVLTADTEPEHIGLGLFTGEWWTYGTNFPFEPMEQVAEEQDVDKYLWGFLGGTDDPDNPDPNICTLYNPARKKILLARESDHFRYSHTRNWSGAKYCNDFFDIFSDKGWSFCSMPMGDFRSPPMRHFGSAESAQAGTPVLRPCFDDIPTEWANAPESSLSAAMLRNLAYAKGDDRIDQMMIQAVKARIDCLREMRDELEARFETAMRSQGYNP